MITIVVKIINQSETWSYKLTNFIFFLRRPGTRSRLAKLLLTMPTRLWGFHHGFRICVVSQGWESAETIGWFPKNWIVRLIMDGLWFENGAESLKMGLPLTKKNGLVLAKTFKISWCELWVLIYKFSEYAENYIHWSFSWRITHVFNVSEVATDPYQKQILPVLQGVRHCAPK